MPIPRPGASSWTLLALWVDSPHTAVAAMLLASLSTAFSDVVVDSIVVERSRGAPQVGKEGRVWKGGEGEGVGGKGLGGRGFGDKG